ncbi:trk system potassium uptake protein TrkA [Tepidamorphus gemmatus]|uniref:Trk system potassium uptake protein TrkA n=1 Tax=Tepidamorphus gemmatus TaxID=747076 RepID=A0A4R3MKM2_9HYPH|nr:Trk system potassium transporter TrkA [Tepidamorphus gemmatus]TCT12380.1 trk system potassium uptake protein TrkA [Tepidamorphus gemmatus]
MKVVISGAGQVGFGIAEKLAAEGNDVSIIDSSPRLIQSITESLDVRGFVGHGAHPDVLSQAGIEQADMLIAVTLHDEVNMVACQVAHSLFSVPTKVARVRAQSYLAPHWRDLFSRDHLPIDVIISPEVEVGEMVLRRLALPGAFDTVTFADGKVVVAGVYCDENCPIVDTPLHQLTDLFPDLKAIVIGLQRGDRFIVPSGQDQILVGDIAYFAADRDQVRRTLGIFGHEEEAASRVVIVGGGNIGFYVAREIEARQRSTRVKVIESSRDRAVAIADELKRTVVLHGSALDEDLLREADVTDADTVVAVTNNDEVNILACVMSQRLGASRSLCLINNRGYPDLTRSLGISAYVNPRQITVSKILQHVRRGRIRAVHSVQNGAAEIIEAEALETSPLLGKPLRELDLFDGIRIGAIYRAGKVITPRGDTQIQPHDRIVMCALADQVRRVEQMFRVSLEFF